MNKDEKDVYDFITYFKEGNSDITNSNYKPMLNKLCNLEDWDNAEIKELISDLQNVYLESYTHRKDWSIIKGNILQPRKQGYIHRKDWEWSMGILAMQRLGKLNKDSTALGIGVGREEILFYLANKLKHVYATDIYDGKQWETFAPSDFPENPKKYSPIPYKEEALTVLRMDGTKIDFPSQSFDIVFSFSSIEHFGGENHEGSLKSLREIERVLKQQGIAIIATEFIINDKDHQEFFNRKTIYSHLIDKLDSLKLIEPLDLRLTTKTIDTIMDYSECVYWDTSNDDVFRSSRPLIVIKHKDILFTSVMLVFKKE